MELEPGSFAPVSIPLPTISPILMKFCKQNIFSLRKSICILIFQVTKYQIILKSHIFASRFVSEKVISLTIRHVFVSYQKDTIIHRSIYLMHMMQSVSLFQRLHMSILYYTLFSIKHVKCIKCHCNVHYLIRFVPSDIAL